MTSPAVRALTSWLVALRHRWRSTLVVGVVNPTLFLAAMGVGLGSIVDRGTTAADTLGGVDYLTFLAPGLLAASTLQSAAAEATWPVLAGIKWTRTYHAMLATPLRVVDVLAGQLSWIALRLAVSATLFLAVTALFGAVTTWGALLAVPAAVLTGMSVAAPLTAFSATQETEQAFAPVVRFGIMPMFLFSGTFFPISQLPAGLRPVAWVSPLWHGVDLCRALALGRAGVLRSLGHVVFLAALVVLGIAWGRRSFHRRLAL